MADRMAQQGVDHLWLDATGLEEFDARFPTLAACVRAIELDPAADWLPIAPAAHYLSGGVLTDLDGASALPGLWAAGESACSGVHGANRLASNSLLEGMVFGARLSEAIRSGKDTPDATGALRMGEGATIPAEAVRGFPVPLWMSGLGRPPTAPDRGSPDLPKLRDQLQRAMTEGAGVLRSEASLARAAAKLTEISRAVQGQPAGRQAGELANLTLVSTALLSSAALREETRGAHARRDHPEARPEWRRRLVHGAVSQVPAP
jgi:L-aspartate oxidase